MDITQQLPKIDEKIRITITLRNAILEIVTNLP